MLLDINDPQKMGLLSLGLRLMSTPGKFGAALGQSGLGALGDMRGIQAQNDQRQDREQRRGLMEQQQVLQQLQLQQAIQAQKDRQAQAEAQRMAEQQKRGFLGSLDTSAGVGQPFDPARALAAGLSPQEIGLFQQKQTTPTAGIQEYEYAKAQGYKGTFADFKLQNAAASAAQQINYGSPIAGIGLDGKPVFFQPSKTGGAPAIIPNVRPPESKAGEKPLTEAQAKAATFQSQMNSAEQELANTPLDPTKVWNQADVMMAGGLTNFLSSPSAQRARQAQEQWSEAFLRFKTGAAATKDEVILNVRTFFPQPGDSKEVIEQKKRMRQQAVHDVSIAAGKGSEKATQAGDTSDPLGLR